MIHALYVNANGHVRPRMCTPPGLLGSACLLHEEPQPLSLISKLPEPFQNPHEGGPGVDTTSITAMMAGPMAALVPRPNLPGSTGKVRYSQLCNLPSQWGCVIWLVWVRGGKLIYAKEMYDKGLVFARHCFRTWGIHGEPVLKKLVFSWGTSGYLTWGQCF